MESNKTENEIIDHLGKLEKSLPKTRVIDLSKPLTFKMRKTNGTAAKKAITVLLVILALSIVLPPFYWPVNGRVSSGFLSRIKPDSPKFGIEVHHGIDIAANKGTNVFPTAIGQVIESGTADDLGNYVRIRHLFGFESLYAHMDTINTSKHSIVYPGFSSIGTVGNTGRSTGPHLHFGVYLMGTPCPPQAMLVFHSIRKGIVGF
jgi:murein DD-endopeptidase MepM/ murein hydrolase activator NlpD